MAKCKAYTVASMRHRITIQSRARVTDGQGGFTETWADSGQVWASIEPMKQYERFQAMQMQSPATHKITIRYREGLTTANRINYQGRIFDIKEVINVDEDNAFMKITAIEV